MNKRDNKMNTWKKVHAMGFSLSLSLYAGLASATNIGSPGKSGFFKGIVAWMQEMVDFFEGPLGLFVSIAALSMAAMIWALGSRGDEGLGRVGRVVIAVLLLVNIPGLISSLKTFSA